jgi:prolyl-tRNA editing enzyme YbaK/EbsC (Cys-tRNA(Pro) deacylase)
MSGESSLPPSAQRVQAALRAAGHPAEVTTFDQSTRSSAEAAQAIGCSVAEIAKSLVFRAKQSGRPVLVIASGDKRVDEKKLKALLGEKVGRADADFVREKTGYAIGGVPPLAHSTAPLVLLDETLWRFQRIWAAAGTPNAVFPLSPDDLPGLTGGERADVAQD